MADQQSTDQCLACRGRGEICGPGSEMECRQCDGLGTVVLVDPRPLVPGKTVRAPAQPATASTPPNAAGGPGVTVKDGKSLIAPKTCSRCGATAVAFICYRRGCPVNGGAAYG
jgi:RecJ-like exonuclease